MTTTTVADLAYVRDYYSLLARERTVSGSRAREAIPRSFSLSVSLAGPFRRPRDSATSTSRASPEKKESNDDETKCRGRCRARPLIVCVAFVRCARTYVPFLSFLLTLSLFSFFLSPSLSFSLCLSRFVRRPAALLSYFTSSFFPAFLPSNFQPGLPCFLLSFSPSVRLVRRLTTARKQQVQHCERSIE